MANESSNKMLPITTIEQAARNELRYMKGRMEGKIKSLKTPWRKFNQASMDGLEWGSITTIAGMSGSGKTAILNELETGLFEMNPEDKFAVLSFNFEMMARRLVGRKISRKLQMTVKQMYNADKENIDKNLNTARYNKAIEYCQQLRHLPVYYIDVPGTVDQIKNMIEKVAIQMDATKDLKLLVTLDHSILVRKKAEQSQLDTLYEVGAMFNEMKKKIDSAYVIVSQLNRGIESVERIQNKNLHHPQKSDVFGADALYQYSDVFLISHRPEMLGIKEYGVDNAETKGIIYWHYIKCRDGDPLIAKMRNLLHINKVVDYD